MLSLGRVSSDHPGGRFHPGERSASNGRYGPVVLLRHAPVGAFGDALGLSTGTRIVPSRIALEPATHGQLHGGGHATTPSAPTPRTNRDITAAFEIA
jgi:hypothetical protein